MIELCVSLVRLIKYNKLIFIWVYNYVFWYIGMVVSHMQLCARNKFLYFSFLVCSSCTYFGTFTVIWFYFVLYLISYTAVRTKINHTNIFQQ